MSNYVTGWHESDKKSCSDHIYIIFKIECLIRKLTYRNNWKTNWKAYNTFLEYIPRMTIRTITYFEIAVENFNAFNNTCHLKERICTSNIPWWNNDLAKLMDQVRKKLIKAKK